MEEFKPVDAVPENESGEPSLEELESETEQLLEESETLASELGQIEPDVEQLSVEDLHAVQEKIKQVEQNWEFLKGQVWPNLTQLFASTAALVTALSPFLNNTQVTEYGAQIVKTGTPAGLLTLGGSALVLAGSKLYHHINAALLEKEEAKIRQQLN